MSDAWNPEVYERFRGERLAPALDLMALIQPRPGMRVIDLGCGTGEVTRILHDRLAARETVGLDASPSMLARAAAHAGRGVRFVEGDARAFDDRGTWDVVFSNALIQWIPDHAALVPRLIEALAPDGQIALQFPANFGHVSHTTAAEVAAEPPFREALGGWQRQVPVLEPQAYTELLHRHGCREPQVRLQVYPHLLPSRASVVDWVRGTLLTDYEQRLDAPTFARFVDTYRERLLPRLVPEEPFLFTFRRILAWGRRCR